ncbi:hypothetical protein [Konateibacter massiliensis]|uniref:hypothetical protein n=1 Tax=Konateibacter massiliensis TaxID=2002841 RepID=UPI000C15C2CB|nr:hypothetical protein [Konateibacter massiliensis]
MNVTIELINLQTYMISKDRSIIDRNGKYKSTPDVLKILHQIWEEIDDSERHYLEKLVIGTPYFTGEMRFCF